MKRPRIGFALSMLGAFQFCAGNAVLAQGSYIARAELAQADTTVPTGTSVGTGVTNYSTDTTPAPPKVDTENWPWMKKEKPATETAPAPKPATVIDKGEVLRGESPVVEPSQGSATPAASIPSPTASAAPVPRRTTPLKPFKLYGRIDQLYGTSGASFPVLKAMTPKMDPRGMKPLQARAVDTTFSGSVIKSFPTSYEGTWGGNLQLQTVQLDPSYYTLDPMEAKRTAQAMRLGSMGAVNFMFQNQAGGRVSLEPARVMFMVPSGDTEVGAQLDKMFGGGGAGNPMGAMMKQMVQNVPVPVMLEFGDINTSANAGMGEMGVSGNQIRTYVMRNTIRQLGPGVLEQQIITQQTTWSKQTGKPRTSYGETVVRFTSRNSQQSYAQAASVNYGADKRFLMKVVLGGWVTKGQVMNTDPMSSMSGMGGMGGMGNMNKMFGQPGGQQQTMPQIPGLDPNMLKNLMGQ